MKIQSTYIGDKNEKEGTEIGNGFSVALFLLQKMQQAHRTFRPRPGRFEMLLLRKARRRYATIVRSLYRDDQKSNQFNGLDIHEHVWVLVDFDGGYYEVCSICHRMRYQP